MEKKKSTVKTVSFIMVITLIGKVMGLLRGTLIANSYGMGMEANAFSMASLIPNIFFDAIFASAITASFIPVFNECLDKNGKKSAFDFSNHFVTVFGLFTLLLTILGIVFSVPLTKIFASGFDEATAQLCSNLLKILFPTVVFTGVAYAFVGILQSLDEFGIPAAMSIASNGVIILYLIFFNQRYGIYGLAVAFSFGWLMQAVMQIPTLFKKEYYYRPSFRLLTPEMKKVLKLMLPVMVSTWVQPINVAINANFASRLFEGDGATAINYANQLYTIIVGVFVLSITNVIFPRLSRLTASNETKQFDTVISQTLRTMSFLLIPMMIGLMCLSAPIVSLIYERGKFNEVSTFITSKALFYFSIGMIGFGVQAVLSKAFFAAHDGKTPLIAGIISIAANFALCVLLVDFLDVGGLALASAISSCVNAFALFLPMQRRNVQLLDKNMMTAILKMLFAAVIMAFAVVLVRNGLQMVLTNSFVSKIALVSVPAFIGVIVYMIAAYLIGIEESKIVLQFLKRNP